MILYVNLTYITWKCLLIWYIFKLNSVKWINLLYLLVLTMVVFILDCLMLPYIRENFSTQKVYQHRMGLEWKKLLASEISFNPIVKFLQFAREYIPWKRNEIKDKWFTRTYIVIRIIWNFRTSQKIRLRCCFSYILLDLMVIEYHT